MNWVRFAAALAALLTFGAPASAQSGLDSMEFFRALRNREDSKAVELIKTRPTLLNTRDVTGETALMITVTRRDDVWVGYLLSKGADPNIGTRTGDTPLIAASRIGYMAAIEELVARKAKIDGSNRMGETPLIIAVQHRQVPVVRYLLNKGADPDKRDSAQGFSARDYAKRDNRGGEMLRLIEAKKPSQPAAAAKS